MFDQNMTQNFDFDSTIMGNNNTIDNNVDINMMGSYNPGMMNMPMNSSMNEGVQERVINRTFVHEVPQDCFFMIEK